MIKSLTATSNENISKLFMNQEISLIMGTSDSDIRHHKLSNARRFSPIIISKAEHLNTPEVSSAWLIMFAFSSRVMAPSEALMRQLPRNVKSL